MRKRKTSPQPAPVAIPLPRLTYTLEEAAEVLGLGRNTILKLVKDGKLRKLPNTGTRVVIPAIAVDEYLLS